MGTVKYCMNCLQHSAARFCLVTHKGSESAQPNKEELPLPLPRQAPIDFFLHGEDEEGVLYGLELRDEFLGFTCSSHLLAAWNCCPELLLLFLLLLLLLLAFHGFEMLLHSVAA